MSVIWYGEPPFPESDLLPGTKRFRIGNKVIDWNEPGEPSQEWIDSVQTQTRVKPVSEVELLRSELQAKGVLTK